jgi:hypothetical protein
LIAAAVISFALPLTRDSPKPTLTPTEAQLVREIIKTIPIVARERYDRWSGIFSWNVPSLPSCDHLWGLPLSSLDPFEAVFFKAIYAGRSANVALDALRAALEAKNTLDLAGELFCDPLTWRGYVGDLEHRRPAASDYGTDPASMILKDEILSNREGRIEAGRGTSREDVGLGCGPCAQGC